ncbi:MAG TPA: MBL fold metallo-hydrolase [Syntrophomonadaceae bacterium]|nr:MBL fold metallo-hydrolase [Syntrophomonadaceae bacterium]
MKAIREMPWDPPFIMNVFYYLVDGLLIDTGPSSLASISIGFFNSHTINQVFLTHLHEDHAGMAFWMHENKQTPVYLHPGSIEEALREPDLAQYRLDLWGKRRAFQAVPAPPTISTGKHLFQVIDTPGHCRCHNVLYEQKQGWLFSGDLLTNLKPASVFYEEDLGEMLLSIKKLLDFDIGTVFCTHRGIFNNGRELLVRKLNYLLQLQERIRDLRAQGLNDEDINHRLFPRSNRLEGALGEDFSSYYIVHTL